MTDETTTTEHAYGREGLERASGFVPFKDESKDEPVSEELTKDEAAARLKELSGPESAIVTHTTGLPDNATLTLDQAGDALADARHADEAQADLDETKAQQKEIDKLRGVEPEGARPIESEIDIEKALASPKVQAAITERVTAAEAQREAYLEAVDHAGKFAIAALASDFPELAQLPLSNWTQALQIMHAQSPERFQQAIGRIQQVARVEAAAQELKADLTAREQAEFREYSAREDARFAEMVKGERDLPAIEREIVFMVKDYGIDPGEFFKMGNESKFLRSAAAQKILVDAAKYRMLARAPKALPTRDVPHVQRPGIAEQRGSAQRNDVNLASLSAKLAKSGSLKDAVALRLARSKGR